MMIADGLKRNVVRKSGGGLNKPGRTARRKPLRTLGVFGRDVSGAMAISVGMFSMLIMGIAVLAMDVGRMVVLKTQLQHAADAAALAAAVQLTGVTGAMTLAEAVARNAAQNTTDFIGSGTTLTVDTVDFFRNWTPGSEGTGDAATDDSNAVIVRVRMNSQTLELFMQPVLNVITTATSTDTAVMTAYAVAENSAVACETPPLMFCNPYEGATCADAASDNLYDLDKIGRQFTIKEGPGGVPSAPGEFGLLELPDGSSAAGDLGAAIASVSQVDCQGPEVTTAPGSKTNQIVWGFQARFDNSKKYDDGPAPNIYQFAQDDSAGGADVISDGDWNPSDYINTEYVLTGRYADEDAWETDSGLTVDETGVPHLPTRYQVYLWSLGVSFAIGDNGAGKDSVTAYPTVDSDGGSLVPAGWTNINGTTVPPATTVPDNPDIPDTTYPVAATTPDGNYDRVAAGTDSSYATYNVAFDALNGGSSEVFVQRRNMKSAVLDCNCLGVAGAGTYNMSGRVIESFLIMEPTSGGGTATVYSEILGMPAIGIGYGGASEDIVRNVKLIE